MIGVFLIEELIAVWGRVLLLVVLASVVISSVISVLCYKRLVRLQPQFGQLPQWQPWQLLFRCQPNIIIRILMILCCYGLLYLSARILVSDLVGGALLYVSFSLLLAFWPQIKHVWQRRSKDVQWLDMGDAHDHAGRYEEALAAGTLKEILGC
jgi:hypothetical protein